VAQNIGHAEYLAGRHAGSVQHVSPCRSRTTHQCGFDLGFQDGAMRQPTFAMAEARIADQFRAADDPAERCELLLPVGGNVEEAVGRGKGA